MAPARSLPVNTLRSPVVFSFRDVRIGQQRGLLVVALGGPDQDVGTAEDRGRSGRAVIESPSEASRDWTEAHLRQEFGAPARRGDPTLS